MDPSAIHEHEAVREQEIRSNMASIDRMPATHLTTEERARYRALAEAGREVYAYPHESSTTWNVWYEDVRIPYGPDSRRWSIEAVTLVPDSKITWAVTLWDQHEQTTRTVLLTCYHPADVVPRHILDTVQFWNTFHGEPIDHSI